MEDGKSVGCFRVLWYICGMKIKARTSLLALAAGVGLLSATAQVSVDYYADDGSRYVCSQQDVLYDDFFHAARFAVAATATARGLISFSLEVTYEEGLLHVSQGDSLTLVLRGGDRIVLKTDRDVTRSDIVKRHFLTRDEYYITCHYPLSTYDVQRITRNRVTKLSAQTGEYVFDRKLERFQDSFRRLFTAVYRYLNGL